MNELTISGPIANALTSHLALLLVATYVSFSIFTLVERFYSGTYRWGKTPLVSAVISSLINATALILFTKYTGEFHTIFPVIVLSILFVIEMVVFIEEDYWQSYVAIGFCIAIHLAVNYDVGAAVLQYWHFYDLGAFVLGGKTYFILLYVFSCFATGTILWILQLTPFFPDEEFKIFVHSWKKGALLAIVVVSGTIIILATHLLMAPTSSYIQDTEFVNVLYLNTAIKSSFILATCYGIIVITTYSERIGAISRDLADKLKEENAFRKSSQRNVLYYYQVNTKSYKIIDKNDMLNKNLISSNMDHNIFLANIRDMIHPGDIDRISTLATFSFIDKNEEESYSINERVRMTPDGLLKIIADNNIEETKKARQKLENYDKDYIWVEISTSVTYDENEDSIIYITVSDVDDKVEIETNLIQAAQTDVLTGLLNRQASEDIIKTRILKKEEGALFMMDLDGFKGVNDTLGHPRGDDLLVETADRLRELFRGEDVICRLGGDEFMIFAVGLDDENIISERARVINRRISQNIPVPDSEKTLPVTASIGIAMYPQDATSFSELYKKADEALYHSKNNGKNTYTFYNKL